METRVGRRCGSSTTKFSEEQERLHREIEERQASLEALATRKSEVEAHKASLPGEQLQRRREATLKNLAGDRGLVAARGSLYGDQVKARERRVQDLIDKPQYNKLVKEYEEFQDVEMGLDSLPKTYKQAILAHHGTVKGWPGIRRDGSGHRAGRRPGHRCRGRRVNRRPGRGPARPWPSSSRRPSRRARSGPSVRRTSQRSSHTASSGALDACSSRSVPRGRAAAVCGVRECPRDSGVAR